LTRKTTVATEQLTQLSGTVDAIYAESGFQPRLLFNIKVTNRNPVSLNAVNIRARLHVEFTDRGGGGIPQLGRFLGDLAQETYSSNSINPGDNYWRVYAILPLPLFSELEEARQGKNPVFQINIACTVIERNAAGELGSRTLAAEVNGGNPGGNQFLSYPVARSDWDEIVNGLGYTDALRATRQTIAGMVADIGRAREAAEGFAEAAKLASTATAVTSLSTVYAQEEKKLGGSARLWVCATSLAALVAIGLIGFFVYESKGRQFGVPQAILRVGALSIAAYGFALCLKNFNAYRHLQLLNRHRANIGQTFAALLTAQPSPQAKDVLAAVTADQMVNFGRFSLTGKDTEENQAASMLEIAKAFLDTKRP
jgi:hypothetical protein